MESVAFSVNGTHAMPLTHLVAHLITVRFSRRRAVKPPGDHALVLDEHSTNTMTTWVKEKLGASVTGAPRRCKMRLQHEVLTPRKARNV
jgi:hypothetical protein